MRRGWLWILLIPLSGAIFSLVYVRSNPLIFNESLWSHAHCIKLAGLELYDFADKNEGKFPFHPKGYGNALLLLNEECYFALTGPGYDASPFHQAKRTGAELPEEECGRVYVQGLTKASDQGIALLFDKMPTPGGDHCHFPQRLWAPLGREVWFVGGYSRFVEERDWPTFAEQQIVLLTKEGYTREEAARLFTASPKLDGIGR